MATTTNCQPQSPPPTLTTTAKPETTQKEDFPFPVGTLVTVAPRTWPGINKPGGAGKVTKAYRDNDGVHRIDVRYFLGTTEKHLELEFVTKQVYLEHKTRERRRPPDIKDEHPSAQPETSNNTKKGRAAAKKKTNLENAQRQKRKGTVTPTPIKKGKKVRTNPKPTVLSPYLESDEEELESSIPREITIVSCGTSTGSLSFNENLANTNPKKEKAPVVRNHKKLSLAAQSNRKLTEYFPKSPLQITTTLLGLIPSNTHDGKAHTTSKQKKENSNKAVSEFKIHQDGDIIKKASKATVLKRNSSQAKKAIHAKPPPLKETSNIVKNNVFINTKTSSNPSMILKSTSKVLGAETAKAIQKTSVNVVESVPTDPVKQSKTNSSKVETPKHVSSNPTSESLPKQTTIETEPTTKDSTVDPGKDDYKAPE